MSAQQHQEDDGLASLLLEGLRELLSVILGAADLLQQAKAGLSERDATLALEIQCAARRIAMLLDSVAAFDPGSERAGSGSEAREAMFDPRDTSERTRERPQAPGAGLAAPAVSFSLPVAPAEDIPAGSGLG